MGMGSGLLLLALTAILLSWQRGSVASTPSFLNMTCVDVLCGMGKCTRDDNSSVGFSCECNPGWAQLNTGGLFPYLPCNIPKCPLGVSCCNVTGLPLPPPPPPPVAPQNSTLGPCAFSLCGPGDCVSTSFLSYRCDCHPGYSNLLNNSALICIRESSLGEDCQSSITPTNQSSPGVPGSSNGAASSPRNMAWILPVSSVLLLALRR